MSKEQIETSFRSEFDIENEKTMLEEYLDLSLREILILFFIMRFPSEVQKNSLREEVNNNLRKGFSPSSFYNILDKLEKKKLIVVNKEGKIVKVTTKADEVIFELSRMTLIGMIDFKNMTEGVIPRVLQKVGVTHFTKTLVINLEIMMNVSVLNMIHEITDNMFILSTPQEFKRYQLRGLEGSIRQSSIIDNRIREANDFFDSILIIGYQCYIDYSEKLKLLLQNELKRVLNKNGLIFLVSDTHPQIKEEHFLFDMINKIIGTTDFISIVKKDELLQDIESLGFSNPDAIEYKGMIVGWGKLL